MKKILTASLVAMMAVSAANADIASTNYVTKSIEALDGSTATNGTAAGKYVVTVSQTDGTVGSATVGFDTKVSDKSDDKNAPTSKAVYDYVEGELKPLSEGASSVDGRVTALEELINGDEEKGVIGIPDLIDEKEDKGTAAALIDALDVSKVTADEGKYFNIYSETNGKVSMEQKAFDTTVTAASKNAPTSGAVNSAITTAVGDLDVAKVTAGDGMYFNAYSETDGKVSMEEKAFDTTVTAASKNAPTSGAVYNAIGALDVAKVTAGDGKYFNAYSETDGKVSMEEKAFDTAVTAGSKNAPTSDAVHTAINAVGQTAGTAVQRSQVGMEDIDFQVSEACKAKDVVCSLTIKGTGTKAVAQWEVVQY